MSYQTSCLPPLYHTEVTCDILLDPANGGIQYTTGTIGPLDYLTTATYVCNLGFGLSGGNVMRTCISSMDGPGVWNGTAPICEGI